MSPPFRGRRRERFPDQSVYNRVAELEWDSPIGESKYFGGDAMLRVDAFRQVDGYNPEMIAGEDPDLSVRIRQHEWIILRIDAEMTLHDMAMTRFSQWWKRNMRIGFAFAQGAAMHGRPPERHWARELRRTIFWGLLLPLFILVLAWPTRGMSLVLSLAYPTQALRIIRRHRKQGMPARRCPDLGHGTAFSAIFPTPWGRCHWSSRLSGRHQTLIEYKENHQ